MGDLFCCKNEQIFLAEKITYLFL